MAIVIALLSHYVVEHKGCIFIENEDLWYWISSKKGRDKGVVVFLDTSADPTALSKALTLI